MSDFPWLDLELGFIGVFGLMAVVLVAVGWLRHGANDSGGGSDGE